jgi:MFS family permease
MRQSVSLPESTVPVGLVSGGHFLSHLYILVYPPLFPMFVDDFGLNNTQLGLTMSVGALAMFLFQIPAGTLVDYIGAKRVLVTGLTLTGLGTALVGVAGSYWMLLAFAVVAGIGQSAFHPANYALLDALTGNKHKGKSFGIHTFAGYAGFAVAPILIGGAALLYGWRPALVGAGVVGLAFAVVIHITMGSHHRDRFDTTTNSVDTPAPAGASLTNAVSNLRALVSPPVLMLFVFFVTLTMASSGIQTFTTLFVTVEFSLPEFIGNTALTAYMTTAACGVLIGGVLADRHPPHRIIILTLIVAAFTTFVTAGGVVSTRLSVVTAFVGLGFFYGMSLPARDSLITTTTSKETRGQSFGIVYTGLPLGGFVAPAALGSLIDITGRPWIAFIIIGLFFLLSVGVVVMLTVVERAHVGTGGAEPEHV